VSGLSLWAELEICMNAVSWLWCSCSSVQKALVL